MATHGRRPGRHDRQRIMVDGLNDLSYTEITLGVTGLVALVAFLIFIVVPSWVSYGRLWERAAAAFLSLYIGAAILGVGIATGVGVIAIYLRIEST